MTRALGVLLGLGRLVPLVSILAIFAILGRVAAQEPPSADLSRTSDQIRASFVGAGFQVDQPRRTTWTSPPVTMSQIYDQSRGRVLMALVYSDAAAARTARLQAEAHEPEQASIAQGGYGPHLVPGYGKSIWRGNVALVQTTQAVVDHIFRLQSDRDNGILVDTIVPSPPDYAVDLDFQQLLESSIVSL